MKWSCTITKDKMFFFEIAFILFFVALFLEDVYKFSSLVSEVARVLRFASYIIAIIQVFICKQFTYKRFVVFVFLILLGLIYMVTSRSIYLVMLFLLILGGQNVHYKLIFRDSFFVLLTGTLIILAGCFIGIIPDFMTAAAHTTVLSRHSFGFYHSNVLPSILIFLEIYLLLAYEKVYSHGLLFCFFCVQILVYITCRSRICLAASILIFACGLMNFLMIKVRVYRKCVLFVAKNVAFLCAIMSVVGSFFVTQNALVSKIDLIISDRFYNSLKKMELTGFPFVNLMSDEVFYSDNIVVDNGYMYLILRFGWIFVFFLVMINRKLIVLFEDNIFSVILIAIIFLMGFVDNDFLSYGFLPFLVAALGRNMYTRRGVRSIDEYKITRT